MTTRARPLLVLLVPAALGGCAALGYMSGLGGDGTDPTVPLPDAQLEGELPDELFGVAGWLGDLLIGTEPWDPEAPRPLAQQAVEAVPANAAATTDDCPYMPTVGLVRPRVRRAFDRDSIRAPNRDAGDSLAPVGALPRGDAVVIVPDNGAATRMPIVPLDSTGYPIRVVPLCRTTGSGR